MSHEFKSLPIERMTISVETKYLVIGVPLVFGLYFTYTSSLEEQSLIQKNITNTFTKIRNHPLNGIRYWMFCHNLDCRGGVRIVILYF